jgi:aldehyde:ferredoxin oxidoreductase
MKEEYYERRQWVDGVVPDERLDELGIDVGPGTGVSRGDSAAPADD